MTRTIFRNTFLVGASVLLLCALLFFGLQYTQNRDETYAALRQEAVYAENGLALGGLNYLETLERINRITWIDENGDVLYDSEFGDLAANQRECAEVKLALEEGEGGGIRLSESSGARTMYYAVLCRDGTILRLSRPLSSIQNVLLMVSPVLWIFVLVLLISGGLAFRMASQIVQPINALNLDEPEKEKIYPELSPLVGRLEEQNLTIAEQMDTLTRRQREFSTLTNSMSEGFLLTDQGGVILSANRSMQELMPECETGRRLEECLRGEDDGAVGGEVRAGGNGAAVGAVSAGAAGGNSAAVGAASAGAAGGNYAAVGAASVGAAGGNSAAAESCGDDAGRRDAAVLEAVRSAGGGRRAEARLVIGGRTWELIANPVVSGAQVSGIVLLMVDVTEREQREHLRREFSANVSHELKTPLASISGFAELMAQGAVPEDRVREFSQDIYRESQRMIALVNDIIKLSRLDENELPLKWENVDLYDLSEGTLDSLRTIAEKQNISLSLTGTHAAVRGVWQLLDEMVYNLCENAIKYNHEGGSVTVEVAADGDETRLTVRDTGIGIPYAHQSRVFERFYRVDKSHSKRVGGTGLGLSIVKHGAMIHGARVELASEEGKGTAVTLVFPGAPEM